MTRLLKVGNRYPVLYRCEHCGNDMLTRKDLSYGGTCPVCKFGKPVRRHWNGFRYC